MTMSIFSRFADIVNSNINALLDKAEDPQKMIKLIIQEMEDTLVEVRSESAKMLSDKKALKRKLDHYQSMIDDWQSKATMALQKEREDLARAALIEKQKLADVLSSLKDENTLVEESLKKLGNEITELEAKLVETRARQEALLLRFKTVNKRKNVREQLDTNKTQQAMSKFEQYERHIDDIEAKAESINTHSTSDKNSKLYDEFAELEAQDEIEKELQRIKRELDNSKE